MTDVDIANGALIVLGAAPPLLVNLAETRKEAVLCNARISPCRRAVLRMHPWNFAIKRATLIPAETPVYGYTYAIPLPTDCLRLLQVGEINDQVDYRLEGSYILTDEATINIKYVCNPMTTDEVPVEDWDFRDPLFVEALTLYLAWNICTALSQDAELRKSIWDQFKSIRPVARNVDSTEDPMEVMQTHGILDDREGSGYVRDPATLPLAGPLMVPNQTTGKLQPLVIEGGPGQENIIIGPGA